MTLPRIVALRRLYCRASQLAAACDAGHRIAPPEARSIRAGLRRLALDAGEGHLLRSLAWPSGRTTYRSEHVHAALARIADTVRPILTRAALDDEAAHTLREPIALLTLTLDAARDAAT